MCHAKAIWIDRTTATKSSVQSNASLVTMAGRQLAAFACAVNELFGFEQAQQSVKDWMEELEFMDWPTGEAPPDWRRVTIAAAARLANRVKGLMG